MQPRVYVTGKNRSSLIDQGHNSKNGGNLEGHTMGIFSGKAGCLFISSQARSSQLIPASESSRLGGCGGQQHGAVGRREEQTSPS